jgi:hypothetical protein
VNIRRQNLVRAPALFVGLVLWLSCAACPQPVGPLITARHREAAPLIHALELYRADFHRYPDSLTALRPQDIAGPESAQTRAIIDSITHGSHRTAPFRYSSRGSTFGLSFAYGDASFGCSYTSKNPTWSCLIGF